MHRPDTIIHQLRFIALVLGEPDERALRGERIGGHYTGSDEARVYEDRHMLIAADTKSLALSVVRKENLNPVLWVEPDGSIPRSHGEITYLRDHVQQLASYAATIGPVKV
jgi:hypothetical protein